MRHFNSHVRFLIIALAMPVLLAEPVRAQKEAAPAPAAAKPAEVKGADDILLTGERLFNEERRQMDVSRRLTGVYRRFASLLDDLQSNELSQEGGGAALVKTAKGVETLRTGRLPVATDHLRKARGDLGKAVPHIDGADKEIAAIVADLNKIIEGASSILADDRLLKEIREIIKTEEFLRKQTAEWGKKLILQPEAGALDQGRVSRAQQGVIERYVQFFEMLTTARKQAVDQELGARLGKTEQVLVEGKPDARLAAAIDQVTQSKAIGAVGAQDQALVILRKAEKILSEETMSDLVSELARILAAEKDLYQDTKHAVTGAFQAEKSQYEARQIGIGNLLENAIKNFAPSVAEKLFPAATPPATPAAPTSPTSPTSAEVSASLTEAHKAVGVAVTELNAGKQEPALAAELAVIAALEKAIAQVKAELGTEAPPVEIGELAMAEAGEAGDGADAAGEGEGAGEGAGESDSQGEGSAEGQGKGVGAGKGEGAGKGKGKGKKPGRGTPPKFAGDPPDLAESYAKGGKTEIDGRGGDVNRKGHMLDSLSRRNRSAAIQNYVQQLPPEFRQQVAEYYETLAE